MNNVSSYNTLVKNVYSLKSKLSRLKRPGISMMQTLESIFHFLAAIVANIIGVVVITRIKVHILQIIIVQVVKILSVAHIHKHHVAQAGAGPEPKANMLTVAG